MRPDEMALSRMALMAPILVCRALSHAVLALKLVRLALKLVVKVQ